MMKRKSDNIIGWIAIIFSGISVLVGIVAIVIEKVVLPVAIDNFKNLYAPLPYPWMMQSLIQCVLIILFYVSLKKGNIKIMILDVIIMVVSIMGVYIYYNSANSVNVASKINYEYRELYFIINLAVTNIEKILNFISLIMVVLISVKK